jgi:type I protein arginine methyltransferase
MGTLLVNERMLETYIYARKRFLKPGGKMFPQVGRIHVAAFSDEALYGELVSKAAFWLQVCQSLAVDCANCLLHMDAKIVPPA